MLLSTIAISHMEEIKGNKQFMYQLLHNSKILSVVCSKVMMEGRGIIGYME
jgi:hypothetical protein